MEFSTKDNKYYLTWPEIYDRLKVFDQKNIKIYGVPTGGSIICGFLKEAQNVTNPVEADLILDDLIDSGKTKEFYEESFPNIKFYALYDKKSIEEEAEISNIWIVFPWEFTHPMNQTVEGNITRLIEYIGDNPKREGLLETPKRIINSYKELFSGYKYDPKDILKTFSSDGYDQIILLKDIEMYSMCEHHMLPFFGKAHVAYIPDKNIIGISKLARLIDIFSRRLQIQERICNQVTDSLMNILNPKGAACIIEAKHTCMCMRGINKQNSSMITSSMCGVFLDKKEAREELMLLIK